MYCCSDFGVPSEILVAIYHPLYVIWRTVFVLRYYLVQVESEIKSDGGNGIT
ncbi:hypothetical protein BRADI_2g39505v3 [Brachypodium distachyon]|uniref:Uncharacterized protein n=1 Tax=Brachypodium distachyon TaxID=15368 RepID=A0A0Q3G9G7_BRADI|nr:hypothetical protein BRADI_2g39505v3 [Brachypodium distachyon]